MSGRGTAVTLAVLAAAAVSCTQVHESRPAGSPTAAPAPTTSSRSASSSGRTPVHGQAGSPCVRGSAGLGMNSYPHGVTSLQLVGTDAYAVVDGRLLVKRSSAADWQARRLGPLADLVGVDFVDSRHGWAVGVLHAYRTTDGGQHWQRLSEPCRGLRAVHFVDPLRGFAVAGGMDSDVTSPPSSHGVLLSTRDGGRHWRRVTTPPDVQSTCFPNRSTGWLGAHGRLYSTEDGGATWRRLARSPFPTIRFFPTALVQCGGPAQAWAVVLGGVGSSQQAHVAYRLTAASSTPLFSEHYFPTSIKVDEESPGAYFGAMTVPAAGEALFFDNNPADGLGKVSWLKAEPDGSLTSEPTPHRLSYVEAAAFSSPSEGCLGGLHQSLDKQRHQRTEPRLICTNDGGRSWSVAWAGRPSG